MKFLPGICGLLISIGLTPLAAAEIEESLPATKVEASGSFSPQQAPSNLINGSGLNSDDRHDNNGGASTMWHSEIKPAASVAAAGIPASPAWLRFDFSAPQSPESICIWNHNQSGYTNRGLRKIQLYGSADGKAWFPLGSEVELKQAGGRDEAPQRLPLQLGGRKVQSVLLVAISNWGSDVYGLSEVQFLQHREVAEEALPFPQTLELAPSSVYRHRADGQAGREVVVNFSGGKLYQKATLEVACPGLPSENIVIPAAAKARGSFLFLLPAGIGVEKDATITLKLSAGKRRATATFVVPKQRQWTVFVYPHSHVDIGYTNTQANIEIIHKRNLLHAIELAKKTLNYPENARYKWNTEVSWPVERYLATASATERDAIIEAIRKGWLVVDAGYIHDNTSVSADEEMDALFAPSKTIERLSGVKSDVLVQVDVPGISWGIVPAANRNGVRYCLLFNNGGDRVGHSMELSHRPFWWLGQDGQSKVLCLQPGAYTPGAIAKGKDFWPLLAGQTDPEKLLQVVKTDKPRDNFVDGYLWPTLAHLEQDKDYPYDLFPMSWAMADNTPIDADLPEAVKSWNEEYAFPHLVIASAHQIMSAFETKYGNQLPSRRGDFTEYWSDGLGTAAKQTGMNRLTKERLIQASTLWSMLHPGQAAPRAEFAEAWRYVLLGSEHTWCYMNPHQQPIQDMIQKVKFSYFQDAQDRSDKLLHNSLKPVALAESANISVFNTLSWPRSGLVTLPKGVTSLKDTATQKLSNGDTVFLAADVPPLSSKMFVASASPASAPATIEVTPLSLDNGIVKVTLDPASGDIVSLIRDGIEFVDQKAGCRVNSYRYLLGHGAPTAGGPQYAAAAPDPKSSYQLRPAIASGPTEVKISIKENGPVLASLLVESQAEGCKWLKREIRLLAGQPQVEILNSLDKIATTKKEGIHFGFAFDVPSPQLRADIPWGVMEVEKDQFPEGNRNWICFQRWLDIANAERGVTWCSSEAPTFQVGAMTANILGGATNSPEWIRTLQPSATIYSWALNNHWHTNFPLFQEGILEFRYQILPRKSSYAAEKSNCFGLEQARPLIAASTRADLKVAAPVAINNPRIVVSSLKNSADGKALIICLRSLSDQPQKVSLDFAAKSPKALSLCLSDEVAGAAVSNTLSLPPHGVLTLRAEW